MQQLMTREIAKTVPRLYEQDGAEDPTVYAAGDDVTFEQLVTILARLCATPEELASAGSDLSAFADGGDASSWSRAAFAWAAGKGLVEGYDDELGYFSIKEMEELNRQMGFAAVERDEHFSPKPLSAVRRR